MPLLSTYLGHVKLAATQVYLTMTPELLQDTAVQDSLNWQFGC